jgi:hypothetical protein
VVAAPSVNLPHVDHRDVAERIDDSSNVSREESCGWWKLKNISAAADAAPPRTHVRRRTKKSVSGLHRK